MLDLFIRVFKSIANPLTCPTEGEPNSHLMLVDKVSSALLNPQIDPGTDDLHMDVSSSDEASLNEHDDPNKSMTLVAFQNGMKKEAMSRRHDRQGETIKKKGRVEGAPSRNNLTFGSFPFV